MIQTMKIDVERIKNNIASTLQKNNNEQFRGKDTTTILNEASIVQILGIIILKKKIDGGHQGYEFLSIRTKDTNPTNTLAIQILYNKLVDEGKINDKRISEDGIYGSKTEKAVAKIQEIVGGRQTGNFGIETKKILGEVYKKAIVSPEKIACIKKVNEMIPKLISEKGVSISEFITTLEVLGYNKSPFYTFINNIDLKELFINAETVIPNKVSNLPNWPWKFVFFIPIVGETINFITNQGTLKHKIPLWGWFNNIFSPPMKDNYNIHTKQSAREQQINYINEVLIPKMIINNSILKFTFNEIPYDVKIHLNENEEIMVSGEEKKEVK